MWKNGFCYRESACLDYTNGDSSDLTESNSLEEDLQKAISTAERRKVSEMLFVLFVFCCKLIFY